MPEFGGLQIEVRCVRCGRLPTADIALYEMRNHLYICAFCRQEAEHKGKLIAWVNGSQALPQLSVAVAPISPVTLATGTQRTRPLTSALPPDNIFALLDLPLETPVPAIRETIKKQMAYWMKKPDSAEKKAMIARLREFMEKIQDEQAFAEYCENLRAQSRQKGGALSVGGQAVFTALEFLDACEKSWEGWADGERYLRNGRLRQWIAFQLQERELAATEARRCQTWTSVSDFRALNEMLYCMVPARPFRLYREEKWQPLDTVPSADTPATLAMLCDVHWSIAENHLYSGSMIYWLEHARGVPAVQAYYDTAIYGYATQRDDRGVGLELLLEYAVPGLTKPELVVEFDGQPGSYTLAGWDREIEHKPVAVTITNMTRGFTSLQVSLEQKANITGIEWVALRGPVAWRGRPGAGMPAKGNVVLANLEQLKWGHIYRRKFYVKRRGEQGDVSTSNYPITVQTMRFYQGLRGKLWMWGVRGGIPGFGWNFVTGILLTLMLTAILAGIISAIVPQAYFNLNEQPIDQLSFGIVLQAIAAGLVNVLHFSNFIPSHGFAFPLVAGVILGLAGFCIGRGKGHADYADRRNAVAFRKLLVWFSLIFAGILLWRDGGFSAIVDVSKSNTGYYSNGPGIPLVVIALQVVLGTLLAALLFFLVGCILSSIHYRLEKNLRKRYAPLTDLPGRL